MSVVALVASMFAVVPVTPVQAAAPQTLSPLAASASTSDKPQSKVWQYSGSWWLVAPSTNASPFGTWIWKLDADRVWRPVVRISTRTDTHADVRAIGNVAHILLYGASPELYSVQYNTTTSAYEPWASRTTGTAITLPGSETATIDVDSTGRMWLATESGSNLNVYYSASPYTTFAGPVTLASNISDDDIGVVKSLPNGTVGVLWSNQTTKRFGFRVHVDTALPAAWSADELPASQSADDSLGPAFGMADDHMNVKVSANGTLYAAVKTSYDTAGYPKIALLIRRPTGIWDNLYEVDGAGTRALVAINEASNLLDVVYTSSEGFNAIVYKESALSSISFGPRQTLMAAAFNDVSSTKQNWTDSLVVVASDSGNSIGGVIFSSAGGANQAPVAVADSYGTPLNTALVVAAPGVLANDTDANGNPLTAAVVTSVTHGTLSLAANGGFTYTPTTAYTGPDSFTYRANDGSLNSNTVTVSLTVGGAATNQALQLNGSSQYATLGSTSQLRSATFTVELWFKRTGAGLGTNTGNGGIPDAIPLITKGRAEGETAAADINYFLGIDASSGQLVADFEEGQTGATPSLNHPITAATVVTLNVWHHAAATYDGSTWNLYLDGVLDGTLAVGATHPANAATAVLTTVGSALDTTGTAAGFFAGVVDEVRIWSVARSLSQINTTRTVEVTSAQGNLLGVWNLNAGSGSSLADNSGNAITGAAVGTPTWVAGFPITVTVQPGFLRVTTSPALPAQVSLNGVVADSWGLTWVKVAPGSYTVHFSHIEGYTEPADQVVSVTAGNTTTVTGSFTQRGSLRVITSPAVAGTVSVDGVPRNDWGMWTDVPTGAHQVCFGPVAGYNPPACQNITVNAGSLTTVTGTYTANPSAPGATGRGLPAGHHQPGPARPGLAQRRGRRLLGPHLGEGRPRLLHRPLQPHRGLHRARRPGGQRDRREHHHGHRQLHPARLPAGHHQPRGGRDGERRRRAPQRLGDVDRRPHRGPPGVLRRRPRQDHAGLPEPHRERRLAHHRHRAVPVMNYFLGIAGGKLAADFEDMNTGANHPFTGLTTITQNVWHHAAATYGAATWKLYLDGALDSSFTIPSCSPANVCVPRSDSIQHAGLGTALNSTGVTEGRSQASSTRPGSGTSCAPRPRSRVPCARNSPRAPASWAAGASMRTPGPSPPTPLVPARTAPSSAALPGSTASPTTPSRRSRPALPPPPV